MDLLLHPDTKVIKFSGEIVRVGDLQPDDLLMGSDSSSVKVINTSIREGELVRVNSTKGEIFTCERNQRLVARSSGYKHLSLNKGESRYRVGYISNGISATKSYNFGNGPRCKRSQDEALAEAQEFYGFLPNDRGNLVETTVREYRSKPLIWKRNYYLFAAPVNFESRQVPLDSYIVGHWLGDGTSSEPSITTTDKEILEYYKDKLPDNEAVNRSPITYYFRSHSRSVPNGFLVFLQEFDLINNKHIPDLYKYNSREVRMAVLAGLIDSDGYNNDNSNIEIVQKSERLSKDIVFLARSLGYYVSWTPCQKTCTNSANGPVVGDYFRMNICGYDFSELPLLLERKRPTWEHEKDKKYECNIRLPSFENLGRGECSVISIASKSHILLEDFTVI